MLGISALVGIACVPLAAPLSTYVAKNIYRCDRAWARHRDARTAAIKEFLLGVEVIKVGTCHEVLQISLNEISSMRSRTISGSIFND